MAAESTVMRMVWLALGPFSRLFRTNSGKAWVSGAGPAKRLTDGSVLVPSGRPVALGLSLVNGDPVSGQCDLQGWTPVRITPQMVGNVYPIYTAIETKRSKGGKTSADQANFIEQVKSAGGIAGVANSVEAAIQIFRDWFSMNGAKKP